MKQTHYPPFTTSYKIRIYAVYAVYTPKHNSPYAVSECYYRIIRATQNADFFACVCFFFQTELDKRRQDWVPPPPAATKGTLFKYIKNVASASEGCVTDE